MITKYCDSVNRIERRKIPEHENLWNFLEATDFAYQIITGQGTGEWVYYWTTLFSGYFVNTKLWLVNCDALRYHEEEISHQSAFWIWIDLHSISESQNILVTFSDGSTHHSVCTNQEPKNINNFTIKNVPTIFLIFVIDILNIFRPRTLCIKRSLFLSSVEILSANYWTLLFSSNNSNNSNQRRQVILYLLCFSWYTINGIDTPCNWSKTKHFRLLGD